MQKKKRTRTMKTKKIKAIVGDEAEEDNFERILGDSI